MLSGRGRAIQDAALTAVKACEVPATTERRPDQPVAIDVDTATAVAPLARVHVCVLERRLIHLGDAGLGRIVTEFQPDDAPRYGEASGDPDRAIDRVRNDPVGEPVEPHVLRGIHRLIWLRVLSDPTVPVGVDDGWTPTLRSPLIAGFVVEPCVQPPNNIGGAAQPERIVLVVGELQVVRHVARIDEHELLGLRVIVRKLSLAAVDRKVLRRRVIRFIPTPGGIVGGSDQLSDPEASLAIHHWVVGAVSSGGRALGPPIRGRQKVRGSRIGITSTLNGDSGRHIHPRRAVGHRVGDDEPGTADAVQRAVRIQVGIPFVGDHLVVHHRVCRESPVKGDKMP